MRIYRSRPGRIRQIIMEIFNHKINDNPINLPGYFYTAAYLGKLADFGTNIATIAQPFTGLALTGISAASYGPSGKGLTAKDKETVERAGIWLLSP